MYYVLMDKESFNPTVLMSEFIIDIRKTGILDVLEKYQKLLPPHEVVGFISSELHMKSSRLVIKERVKKRK